MHQQREHHNDKNHAAKEEEPIFAFPESGGFLLPFNMDDLHCAHNQRVLQECSRHLHQSHLVAFPTETVYGLGANALSEKAVLSIFLAKKRPLTDPVIVHVLDVQEALPLVDLSESAELELVYRHLAKSFWPGPLTLVAKANRKIIPACVTANTGFVGIRSPKHPVARSLIEVSKLPIAAPSANRFGHVSPTVAAHVMEDLGDSSFPIAVMDVGQECCHVGIESTVAKLEMVMEPELLASANSTHPYLQQQTLLEEGRQMQVIPTVYVTVLRKGGISVSQIEASVKQLLTNQQPEISKFRICVQTLVKKVSNNTTIGQSAPGQMITHYAPDVPAYLYRVSETPQEVSISPSPLPSLLPSLSTQIALNEVVIIDFGDQLAQWKQCVLRYFSLSTKANIQEASALLFDQLRQSEKVQGAKAVLLANVQPWMKEDKEMYQHADALFDRMFRAASGRFASVEKNDTLVASSIFLQEVKETKS